MGTIKPIEAGLAKNLPRQMRYKIQEIQVTTNDNVPTGAIVGTTDTQTLTNKTLTTPVIAAIYQDSGKTKLMTLPDTASDTLVALAATQTLTGKTIRLAGASDTLGTPTVADNAGSQADPAALTSTDVAAADADATYGTEEATLINELKADVNLLRADVTAVRTALIGAIDYCDSLKTTLNALLGELRMTDGCGVLAD